jgi:PPOX class probable F420-dependent enzyme
MGNKPMNIERQPNSNEIAFAPLRASRVALLTSYSRNGAAVGTPVGIRVAEGKAYFTTWSTTGKVKRIASNPRVTLAACTRTGKAIGPAIAGTARRLQGTEDERRRAGQYSLWGHLWGQIYRLLGYQSVLYEVTPMADSGHNTADPSKDR